MLADVIIQDGSKTRFHACEKRNVCPAVQRLASRYSANADPVLATEALAAYSQIDSSSAEAAASLLEQLGCLRLATLQDGSGWALVPLDLSKDIQARLSATTPSNQRKHMHLQFHNSLTII